MIYKLTYDGGVFVCHNVWIDNHPYEANILVKLNVIMIAFLSEKLFCVDFVIENNEIVFSNFTASKYCPVDFPSKQIVRDLAIQAKDRFFKLKAFL